MTAPPHVATFTFHKPGVSIKVATHLDKLTAILGDAQHRIDVHTRFADFGIFYDHKFLSSNAQAHWLVAFRPDLVPEPVGGQDPNDHTISSVFERHYYSDIVLKTQYINWLYKQNGRGDDDDGDSRAWPVGI